MLDPLPAFFPDPSHIMIATLDRLMALNQKLRDAEKRSERDPIHVALELNEIHLISRMIEEMLGEADPYSSARTGYDSAHD